MQITDERQGSEWNFIRENGTSRDKMRKLRQFLIVLATLILTTILNIFLEHFIQPSSLVFVYLVPTIAGAVYFGTWASVFSFTAGFLIFDFGFVEPYYSLHISKPQDIYNVTVYFTIAALITYLINLAHRQNLYLKSRLDRVSLIEDMSRDFLLLTPIEEGASAKGLPDSLRARVLSQLGQLAIKYARTIVDVPALVFFKEEDGCLKVWAKSGVDIEITEKENMAALWSLNHGEVSGAGTHTCSDTPFYFIPMKSIEEIVGIMGILYDSKDLFPEQRRFLGMISNLTTMVAARWMGQKSQP
jgi:two-component system sensor histidine kinase KdpD